MGAGLSFIDFHKAFLKGLGLKRLVSREELLGVTVTGAQGHGPGGPLLEGDWGALILLERELGR